MPLPTSHDAAGPGAATVRRRARHRGGLVAAAACLPLLAVTLGGGQAPWAAGAVLLVLGELLLFAPPSGALGRRLSFVLGGLALLPALTFLPADWFGPIGWRDYLQNELGLILSLKLTPQPWLTLDAWILLLAGLAWTWWLLAIRWTGVERARLARWMALGVALLALVCLIFRIAGFAPEMWEAERRFGPFANRNQTANFFALGSLLLLARAHLDFRRRPDPWMGLAWLGGWTIVAAAVFTSYSRAGVLLLFGGAAAYLGGVAWLGVKQSRHLESDEDDEADVAEDEPAVAPDLEAAATRERTVRTLAFGASLMLLLAAAFLSFGGGTLERFRATKDPRGAVDDGLGFRLQLQADALDLGSASAWPGIGLGNVGDLLSQTRTRTRLPSRAIHPESDWVWMRVEMGWAAVALAAAGIAFLVWRILPLRRGGVEPVRLAGLIVLAGFVVHGFIDVSGHRLGTALWAIAIVSLAVPRVARSVAPWHFPFRLAGAAFAVIGFVWMAAAWQQADFPGNLGASNGKARAYEAVQQGDVTAALQQVTRALRWAPLDYHAYQLRAEIGAAVRADVVAVADDFARARGLERQSTIPPTREALRWLKWRPERAVGALDEACRRSPAETELFITQFMGYAIETDDPIFRQELRAWARNDLTRLVPYLRSARPEEARAEIDDLVARDPALRTASASQLPRLLLAWAASGDAAALATAFEQHPEWQGVAWDAWALATARAGSPERACQLALRFAPPPALPQTSSEESIITLERDLMRHPDDLVKAYELAHALMKAGRTAEAATTLARVTSQPRVPAFLHYVEAAARTKQGEFDRAWECWQRYLRASRGI